MEFTNISNEEFAAGGSGRRGYALDALEYGKAHEGTPFSFVHSSPNAATRLRTLGLTVRASRVNKPEPGPDGKVQFDHLIVKAVYNSGSKEAQAAAIAAANPKPRKPKGEGKKGKAKKSGE